MSYMKYRPITRILSLAAALFILTACTPHNLPDGWYTASGEGPDTRIGPSIVTCSDFAALHLDSLPSGEGTFIYQITGTVKPEKQKRWTAATRKAVGRHIVFLYEGNVLAAPRINMPIDRGTFAISAPPSPATPTGCGKSSIASRHRCGDRTSIDTCLRSGTVFPAMERTDTKSGGQE